jgi:hypothetical protein
MQPDEASALLQQILACPTFNSSTGRRLEQAGYKALRALPRGLDPALVERVYRRYLDEAPYFFWACLHKVRREHAPAVLAELRGRAGLQARFVAAASAPDPAAAGDEYERMVRAGAALSKIHSFSHAATSRKAADRILALSADPLLAAAARSAIAASEPHQKRAELLVYLWLVVLLAQDGSPASQATLAAELAAAHDHPERSLAPTLERLVGYY